MQITPKVVYFLFYFRTQVHNCKAQTVRVCKPNLWVAVGERPFAPTNVQFGADVISGFEELDQYGCEGFRCDFMRLTLQSTLLTVRHEVGKRYGCGMHKWITVA